MFTGLSTLRKQEKSKKPPSEQALKLQAFLAQQYGATVGEAGAAEDVAKKKKKKKKKPEAAAGGPGVKILDEDPTWWKPQQTGPQRAAAAQHAAESEDDEDQPVVANPEEAERLRLLAEREKQYFAKEEDGRGWATLGDGDQGGPAADASPPRRRRQRHDSPDASPPRRRAQSPDLSPPRRGAGAAGDSDASPPRRGRQRHDSPGLSPPRRGAGAAGDSDASPPRRRRQQRHDSPDASPPRRRAQSPDLSPPRRGAAAAGDGDASPPRRRRQRHDSPDASPPRRRVQSPDLSPPRRGGGVQADSDASPPRRRPGQSPDLSPPRKRGASGGEEQQESEAAKRQRMMSDGTVAGMVSGRELMAEMQRKREVERKRFEQLGTDVTGRGAQTVYRDKEGRAVSKEEFEAQKTAARKKAEYESERDLAWGGGLKQRQDAEERAREMRAEAAKPFARSRDDADLDSLHRQRERWGDPMAHLVKKKQPLEEPPPLVQGVKAERLKKSGFIIPQGVPPHSWLRRGVGPPPNRFGIKPGRHWDGVDRSNGFEQRMFRTQTELRRREQEAFEWAQSDM